MNTQPHAYVYATSEPPVSPLHSPTFVSRSPILSERRLSDIPLSPSEPELIQRLSTQHTSDNGSARVGQGLLRSRTLPRRAVSGTASSVHGLDGVTIDKEKLESLRSWILSLAIGALLLTTYENDIIKMN
jgi:hypothetical protein